VLIQELFPDDLTRLPLKMDGPVLSGAREWIDVASLQRKQQRASEQDGKILLCEMIIMRQDFGDAFGSHRLHGNSVGQAVLLVRVGLVEDEPGLRRSKTIASSSEA
jgi:hypothetical protein